MHDEQIAEYAGWKLYSELEEEEDVRKRRHWAHGPDGRYHSVDFTPYGGCMGDSAFRLWVDLGRPSRAFFGKGGPPENADYAALREIMEFFNIPAEDSEVNIRRLRTTMALIAPEGRYWRISRKG
jgi:hypothetical protein